MEATSDSMIDIQIEESLARETLMTIDGANFKEDILTLAGFFGILFLAAITAVFGPPPIIIMQTNHTISNLSVSDKMTFESTAISSLNRFLSLSLAFQGVNNEEHTVGFSYCLDGKESGIIVNRHSEQFHNVKVGKQNEFHLLLEKVIDYNQIFLKLGLEEANGKFSGVTVRSVTGVPDYTIFQIYYRLVFSCFSLLFFVMLISRLKTITAKHWHLEQQLTVPLLALNFFFCGPFYAIQAYFPSEAFITADTIFNALFTSYLRFFTLVLFDSLRYKNRRTDKCFFFPKVMFLVFEFVIVASRGVTDNYVSFGAPPAGRNGTERAIEYVDNIVYIVYLVWIAWSMLSAARQVDATETYKFAMYLATMGVTVILLGLIQVGFRYISMFKDSSIPFVVSFAIQNTFTLLMTYFHWPYEVVHDQTYFDHTEEKQDNDSNTFYIESND